jgi:hypothetical protein
VEVEKAAQQLAVDQFGVSTEDSSSLPSLPGWVTDEALTNPEHKFENALILLIPPKELIKSSPASKVLENTKPKDNPTWIKIKYDAQGITHIGTELKN